jgi:hypothetical protein
LGDQRAGGPAVRGYVVFREDEPGLWMLVGDVDYQPGLAARAGRVQAVTDALGGSAPESGTGYAALPREQWHVLRHG